jgi:hypothetical protein
MIKTALLASGAALALFTASASAASQFTLTSKGSSHFARHVVRSTPRGLTTLVDQNENDTGIAIVSQNNDRSSAQYDSQGADDFTVPKGVTWVVKDVDVTGVYFNGSGPATSENILIYADDHGLPGKLVAEVDNVKGGDNLGSFSIDLGRRSIKLMHGKYWLSVVANLGGVGNGGQWGWETNSVENGKYPAAWQNQGGGFGVCPTWGVMQNCIGSYGEGPDFMFELKGKKS